MKDWFTLAELDKAKLPGLPCGLRELYRHAEKHGWRLDSRKVRKREAASNFTIAFYLTRPAPRSRS